MGVQPPEKHVIVLPVLQAEMEDGGLGRKSLYNDNNQAPGDLSYHIFDKVVWL